MKPEKHEDCGCSGNSIVRSKGEFTIIVIRKTFDVPFDLPYPIWGTIYLNAKNFAIPLAPYLPAGVSVVSSIVGDTVVLDYTDGTNTDRITIGTLPTSQISYLETLASLNTAYQKTELVYFCCNTSKNPPILTDNQIKDLQQQPLYLQRTGGLNSKQFETIYPLSRRLPNNTIQDITEISMRKQDIKPDSVWIHNFAHLLMTHPKRVVFYWQVIINEVVNMNQKAFEIKD